MKASPTTARVLIATDSADDARQIVRSLEGIFTDVRSSVLADAAVADFQECNPDVLVLAFDTLEKSESYYLGLYRSSARAIQDAHRTVVLCSKEQAQAAFELCRKSYFDDYVLYWPHSYDGNRLAMSIWIACRERMALREAWPEHADLLQHARSLTELESVVADTTSRSSDELRARIEPALAGTRPLTQAIRDHRLLALVVDDDEFARKLVQRTLDAARWDVLMAENGVDALAQLRRVRPDVILMDIGLPGMDGVTLTGRLKAMPHLAGIPVIMMTGDARRETLLRSMGAGAVEFVVKPVTARALQARLDKLFAA